MRRRSRAIGWTGIVGLEGVRARIAMLQTPGGAGRIEPTKFTDPCPAMSASARRRTLWASASSTKNSTASATSAQASAASSERRQPVSVPVGIVRLYPRAGRAAKGEHGASLGATPPGRRRAPSSAASSSRVFAGSQQRSARARPVGPLQEGHPRGLDRHSSRVRVRCRGPCAVVCDPHARPEDELVGLGREVGGTEVEVRRLREVAGSREARLPASAISYACASRSSLPKLRGADRRDPRRGCQIACARPRRRPAPRSSPRTVGRARRRPRPRPRPGHAAAARRRPRRARDTRPPSPRALPRGPSCSPGR